MISHKKAGCDSMSDDERTFFRLQHKMRTGVQTDAPKDRHPKHVCLRGDQPSTAQWIDSISIEERDRITDALAALFYRTGVPFNVVDSSVMRNFIATIRPAYTAHLPSGKSLAGTHLNHSYNKLRAKLLRWISDAPCYSLVSDGWSNASNVHFVN